MREVDKLAGLNALEQRRAAAHFQRVPAYMRNFLVAFGEACALFAEMAEAGLLWSFTRSGIEPLHADANAQKGRAARDAEQVFEAGADKVSVNSAALADPNLISDIGRSFGAQAVVVAIDARRDPSAADPVRGAQVYVQGGRRPVGRTVVEWAREAEQRGAGEILLTSMDSDGTRAGFDCELTAAVSEAVSIPVIASGGAGTVAHFADVFARGKADAALAASIFHFGVSSARSLKEELAQAGVPVRLPC